MHNPATGLVTAANSDSWVVSTHDLDATLERRHADQEDVNVVSGDCGGSKRCGEVQPPTRSTQNEACDAKIHRRSRPHLSRLLFWCCQQSFAYSVEAKDAVGRCLSRRLLQPHRHRRSHHLRRPQHRRSRRLHQQLRPLPRLLLGEHIARRCQQAVGIDQGRH